MRLLLLLMCTGVICANARRPLRTIYKWRYFDYKWENATHKAAAIASGDYNYTKSIIIDADYSKDGRTFVTVIRNDGVPSSLNVVSRRYGPGGPLLLPYPDWTWTKRGDCNGITSVYRVAIDRCNRLWALDNGKIGRKTVCPTQLLAFDLATNKLIKRVKIPDNVSVNSQTKTGLLVTPIVETNGINCKNTTVYMADTTGSGLVIYNEETGKIWRLEADEFRADPAVTNFTILGESFQLMDGILGMAKDPSAPVLYFRPMSSRNMNSATTTDLKRSRDGHEVRYRTIRDFVPSQAAAMAISSEGILFFGLPTELSLACWNTCKPPDVENLVIVARDSRRLQFASGVKIIPSYVSGAGEELLVVTNRMQKVIAGTLNLTDVNFRVMKADVARLTAGTACAVP